MKGYTHEHSMPSLKMFTDEQIEAFEVEWYNSDQGRSYMQQKEQHLKRFIQDKYKLM